MWKVTVYIVTIWLLAQVNASPEISLEDLLERLVTLEDWKRVTVTEVSNLRETVAQQGATINNLEKDLAIQVKFAASLRSCKEDKYEDTEEVQPEDVYNSGKERQAPANRIIRTTDIHKHTPNNQSTVNKRDIAGGVAFTVYLDHDVNIGEKQTIKFNQDECPRNCNVHFKEMEIGKWLKFTDVYCGWPGSVHDSGVLKNSPLVERITENCQEVFPNNTHVLGDAAYGLEPWMMVPFRDYGNLSKAQRKYNYVHSSTRMCIERAFGGLKGRFRRLTFIDLQDISCIVDVVLSCCAPHQLCKEVNKDIADYIEEGMEDNEEVNDFRNFLNWV